LAPARGRGGVLRRGKPVGGARCASC
jgi:hypothetical protein